MKNFVLSSVLLIGLASATADASAQPQVRIQGGNPVLTITTGVAGGEPVPVGNVQTRMRYRQSAATNKITVSTICPGQSFNLSALAVNVQEGLAAPEVSLTDGMLETDFIIDIPPGSGQRWLRCGIRYTASASFSQGSSTEEGDDAHVVTYTIIAQ